VEDEKRPEKLRRSSRNAKYKKVEQVNSFDPHQMDENEQKLSVVGVKISRDPEDSTTKNDEESDITSHSSHLRRKALEPRLKKSSPPSKCAVTFDQILQELASIFDRHNVPTLNYSKRSTLISAAYIVYNLRFKHPSLERLQVSRVEPDFSDFKYTNWKSVLGFLMRYMESVYGRVNVYTFGARFPGHFEDMLKGYGKEEILKMAASKL
jgi:hypothetical protein